MPSKGTKEWKRAYNAAYVQENREQIAAQKRRHYALTREVQLAKRAAYRVANRESIAAKKQAFAQENAEHLAAQRVFVRLRLRATAMMHYGGETPACACCGEQTPGFLTFDHIGGGGNAHRKAIGNDDLCNWLRKNNYPDGFRILCFNCNWADGVYGRCPHVDPTAGDFTAAPPRWIRVPRSQREGAHESRLGGQEVVEVEVVERADCFPPGRDAEL